VLEKTLSLSPHPTTLAAKYTLLETFLEDASKHEYQITRNSSTQQNSNTPHVPLQPYSTQPEHK
jgi:hypothetical protein